MEDPKKAAVVTAITIVCVIIAFAWQAGEPVKGEVQANINEMDLNWCNVAWSGSPDQNRGPDDDRKRVTNWIVQIDLWGSRLVFWSDWETDEQREIRIALGGWVGCDNKPSSIEEATTTTQPATDTTTTEQPATGTSTTGQPSTETSTARQPATGTTTTRQPATGTTTTGQYEDAESCLGDGNSLCHSHDHVSGTDIVDHGGGWHSHTDHDSNCVGHEHEGENHNHGHQC